MCASEEQNHETPTFPGTIPDNWLTYHLVHPRPGYADPGDPNAAWYYNGRYHMHYIYETEESGFSYAHVSSKNMVHWQWHNPEEPIFKQQLLW